jgi:hypothetical protein
LTRNCKRKDWGQTSEINRMLCFFKNFPEIFRFLNLLLKKGDGEKKNQIG